MNNTETLEQYRKDLERSWKRTEAAFAHALHPKVPQVGQTPKDVVWTKNKAKLYRYHAVGERKHATPILMIYALINRPYILDLAPGNSMVEFLVNEGYDVFMLDWGVPGDEDKHLRFDDFVMDYIPRAVKQVQKLSGSQEFSIVGYCMGGAMSVMYAGTHPEAPLKNLVLMATPVDFSEAGLYTAWLNPKYFDVDRIVDTFGNVPSDFLDMGSKLLKPIQNYVGPSITLYDRLHDDEFVKNWQIMNKWVEDGIPLPGETYRQWIKECYQQNKLIKGELKLGGRAVKLENIKANLLAVVAEQDHIVQTCQASPILDKVSSTDKQELRLRAGHVGLVAGKSAKKQFFPKLNEWLAERSN